MRFNILLLSILTALFFNGCQTIKNKSDEVAERENEKFGQFVGKQVSEIRSELGLPTDDYIDELGNETLVYKTKKYGIPCERKFTINKSGTIIGFSGYLQSLVPFLLGDLRIPQSFQEQFFRFGQAPALHSARPNPTWEDLLHHKHKDQQPLVERENSHGQQRL